jgi:hypothetical protein
MLMETRKSVLDVSGATSPLYVRQAVARFLGLSLDRELTWEFLRESLLAGPEPSLPLTVTVIGLPRLATLYSDEGSELSAWLRGLEERHPGISIQVSLHD